MAISEWDAVEPRNSRNEWATSCGGTTDDCWVVFDYDSFGLNCHTVCYRDGGLYDRNFTTAGAKILRPVTELLVGIPSVVYGFIGLQVVVPFVRNTFGGSGYGILSGTFVLFVMILPTVTSMTADALNSVPRYYREASLALGATRWQTIYKVVLRAAIPGMLTAVVFGMARAFGEALAVQMVIGNATLLPHNLVSPAATLTSILTMGIGNTVMGSLQNNALWSLAMILLLMSLVFNLVIRYIGRKGKLNHER